MVVDRKTNKDDVYLRVSRICEILGTRNGDIYKLYNEKKVRWIFKQILVGGKMVTTIHFNLDDARQNYRKDLGCKTAEIEMSDVKYVMGY